MSSIESPLISIVLPVYNRTEYLGQAVDSVLNQSYSNWELLIADDASSKETSDFLKQYYFLPGCKIHTNQRNIGLFANLNLAIQRSQGSYVLLLCSDDILLQECLELCLKLASENPTAKLLLSAFHSIDINNKILNSASIYYCNQYLSGQRELLEPDQLLPLILQHGSINGNLTGMFFHRSLFDSIGGFKENSVQVGDWEWVYRVAKHYPILISKTPVAMVRSHPQQLSALNFKSMKNSLEVIEMVDMLLHDSYLKQLDAAPRWALHIMQFHLWYAVKSILQGRISEALILMRAIDQVTGLGSTFIAMLKWLPKRWRIYQQKGFALPPS
jgi:glycosyltransferase involved in cell wall biosynthesis